MTIENQKPVLILAFDESTAMAIVHGMQKEQENLIKQLDVLREVNQNLRDQKDAIQAAHEAQSAEFVSLGDELAFAQNLERSPAKRHPAVTRQGSEMSKYFATFDAQSGATRTSSRLISVDEAGGANSRSGLGKRKLHRSKDSTQSIQSSSSAQHLIELASEADGAEFEYDRVFEDGELKESERPEWMENVHSALEPVMSEANRKKTKRELGERKTDIAPQLADEADGAEFEDDRDFKEGELKEGDKPEWMGEVHSTTEPVMSEAERMKVGGEYGERRTDMVPQSTVEAKSFRKPLTSSDGVQFEEGELRESEGPEWMEKVNSANEPVMSEAERMKTEREFRERKTNIVPQMTVEGKSSHKSPTSEEEEEEEEAASQSSERTLSPRISPVGTETETQHVHNTTQIPATNSHLQRVFKVVFVGDSGVGKSSFIHRYCYEIWKPSYTATIGVDFQVKSLEIGMKKLALQLWDTAGQERFRSITKQYFRKADGVVLIYDLTSEASFVNIKSWMTSVEEAAEPGCTVMLIGNKLDLCKDDERYRAVGITNAEELAEDYGALYADTSAKTGENVYEAMEILAKLQEQEDWQLHSVLNLKLDEDKKKKKSCCSR